MPRNTLLQFRRGTASAWTSANSVLAAGEVGYETDTGKFKIGDGTTAWTSLLYATDASDLTGTTLSSSIVSSSLTSVGTLSSLAVSGGITQGGDALTPYTGFRNAVMNGDFRINQRVWSSSTANGTYGFDRWMQTNVGGTVTMSSQSFTVGSPAATGYESATFCRMVTSGQSAAGDIAILRQAIEDVRTFANSTVTISFWAKASSGTPKVAVEVVQTFGTGGSPSADVNTYGGQVTLSTSWARYSVTMTVPNINGKTIGTTANTSATQVFLWVSAGSTYASRTGTLGIQNNTFDFWGVQFERGSVATPFEQRPIQTELALCQRYYESVSNTGGFSGPFVNITGATNGSNEFITYIKFAVAKRTAAYTMTGYRYDTGGANAWWMNRSGFSSTPAPTFDQKTPYGCRGYVNVGASWVACEAFPLWLCSDEF